MTAHDDFDRRLAAWLTADAPTREPERLLDHVLSRTARTPRRPAWLIPERWIPMSTFPVRAVTTKRVPIWTVVAAALLILALAVGAAVFVGSQRRALPPPFGPAANGPLVYAKAGDIVTHDVTSGVERILVGGPGEDLGASFSRDGSTLAFFRRANDRPYDQTYDIWVADQDGANPHRMAGPVLEPGRIDWSPTGDTIVVESTVDGKLAMTLVAMDGSAAMTPIDVGMQVSAPTFRPTNGRRLLFRGEDAKGAAGLYLVDRDGGNLVRLGLDAGLQARYAPGSVSGIYYFAGPSWSPDGRRIAFDSYSPMPGSVDGRGLRIHLADIDPTGAVTGETTLADDPVARDEGFAIWLPASDGIVYARNEPDAMYHLAVTRLAPGPAAARDLGVSGPELSPGLVSPDGAKVLSFKMLSIDAAPEWGPWLTDVASGRSEDARFKSHYPPTWQRNAQ